MTFLSYKPQQTVLLPSRLPFSNPLALLLWLPCARHCLDPEAVLLFLGAAVRTESPRVGGRAVSERIGNGDQGQWDDAFEALMVCSPLTSK